MTCVAGLECLIGFMAIRLILNMSHIAVRKELDLNFLPGKVKMEPIITNGIVVVPGQQVCRVHMKAMLMNVWEWEIL